MTTSAAEIRDPASELRKASGSLKRAHLADQLATGVFYVVSGAFVLLLIFFTLYVVWDGIQAFRPEIFSFEATGIGNQFFNTVYLVVLSLLISCPFTWQNMLRQDAQAALSASQSKHFLPFLRSSSACLVIWYSSSWQDPSGICSPARSPHRFFPCRSLLQRHTMLS